VQGIGDNLNLISGMAKKLSKQLTEDLEKVAKSSAEAFKKVLRDNLAADVGFADTVLGNYKAIDNILSGSGTGDALDNVREAEAELLSLQRDLANMTRDGFQVDSKTLEKRNKEDQDYANKRAQAEQKLN